MQKNSTIFLIKKIQILLLLFLLMSGTKAFGQYLHIPGTGVGVPLGGTDANWIIEAVNSAPEPPDETGGIPNSVDTGLPCSVNASGGEHWVEFNAAVQHSGTYDGFWYYDFQIIEEGNYLTNCVIQGNANNIGVYKITYNSSNQKIETLIASRTIDGNSCTPVQLGIPTMTPGEYRFKIGVSFRFTAHLFVSSLGGSGGVCNPMPAMTSANNATINSGETVTIPLTSNVASSYTWVTAGNSNTSVIAGSYTGSPLTKTITNLSPVSQLVTYTVTPTSTVGSCVGTPQIVTVTINPANGGDTTAVGCKECLFSFAPIPGQEYVISAWVQQSNKEKEMKYTGPAIGLDFTNGTSAGPFTAKGAIIDGWQRIDTTFTVPPAATDISVRLLNNSTDEVYFDDIRIHPVKASLKSFVYDPISMRLMAELDENNYATFYEYDEEGSLIRVKKETERGIKTIKEVENNTRKKQ